MSNDSKDLKCDFCSAAHPEWNYTSAAFTMLAVDKDTGHSPMSFSSDERWVACGACKDLIESGDAEGLANRSIDHCLEYTGIRSDLAGRSFYYDMAHSLHATFLATKSAPVRIPLETPPYK